MATTRFPNFDGWYQGFHDFGRIIRDSEGKIDNDVEKKNFTPEIEAKKEVNPGFYCFDAKWLWENVEKVSPTPPSNELYLTNLIHMAREQGKAISDVFVEPHECLGANTKSHLEEMGHIALSSSAR